MVVAANVNLSITVQCHLLSISRSSWYYNLKGENLQHLALMRLIRIMGLRAIYQEPKDSAEQQHHLYPHQTGLSLSGGDHGLV